MPSPVTEAADYREALRTQGYIEADYGVYDLDVSRLFTDFRGFLNIAFQPDGSGKRFVEALSLQLPGRESDGDYYVAQQRRGIVNPY